MDLLDWVLDDLVLTADERQHLNFLAEELELTKADVAKAHEQYFQAMVSGAEKDGIITNEENTALKFVAKALGIAVERVPLVTSGDCKLDDIPVGAAICFTGSFVDRDGNKLSKADLEKLATDYGYTVVSSVTKSKCDVVVAVDPSSSSGKAKKAREFGKPVIASQSFLEQVQS